jgi:cytoskeletal protein CcmA (bactofilin family)
MKRKLLLSLGVILGLGLLSSFAWVGVSHATDVRSGDKPILNSDETTNNSLYIAGNTVTVAGTVKGDLFCAGQDIDISGTIEGDVICAGQHVKIRGKVLGDVRVAGQNVDITANVTGNATAVGELVTLGRAGMIGRDVTLGASSALIEGNVGRDVLGAADTARLAGNIGRNVDADVRSLTLDAQAHIQGNLSYRGVEQAAMAEAATVVGETHFTKTPENERSNSVTAQLWTAFYGLVAMGIVGIAGILLAPRAFDAAAAAFRKRPVASFTGGAATVLFVPVTAVLLFASLFGLPLAFIMFLSLIVGLIGSVAIAGYGLGWVLVEKLAWPPRGRRIASLVLGLLLLTLLGAIPIVGPFITFATVIMGLGAMVVAAAGTLYPAKVKKATK